MNPTLLVMTIIYLAALCLLLWVARRNRKLYAAAKGTCSALFVACALVAYGLGGGAPLQFGFLLAALVLCAFGDVFLGVANSTASHVSKKPFLMGAGSFALGHVLFCAMFYLRAPFKWYDPLLALALLLVLRLLEVKDKVRLKKMRPVGYLYTFMVGLMAGKAVGAAAGALTLGAVGLAAGAVLFLVSDVILLFLYFGTGRYKLLRGVNLAIYYSGMWLLALAAQWL